ncbi:MAG TPA: chitinase, partial [Actinoplanes sp.]|nr:chitinase [Actinoplanes sp.]
MRRSMILALTAVLAAGGGTVYLASSASAAAACATAWSATSVYVKDNVASQSGHNYTAKWWTQNESPSTHSGQWDVWIDNGVCGDTPPPTTPPPTTPPPTTPPTTPP